MDKEIVCWPFAFRVGVLHGIKGTTVKRQPTELNLASLPTVTNCFSTRVEAA